MTNVTVTIEDNRIIVQKKTTLPKAAWKAESFLSTLCHDPTNSPLSTASPPFSTTG